MATTLLSISKHNTKSPLTTHGAHFDAEHFSYSSDVVLALYKLRQFFAGPLQADLSSAINDDVI